jgi:phosphomannomutase
MLPTIAVARGVLHEETLTGFKWIVRATGGHPGSRFVFGYEEALGYCVGEVVRDKDGIGAALAFLRLAAEVKAAGASIAERLDALARLHGVHLTAHLSLRLPSPEAAMERLRADRPRQLGSVPVEEVLDLGSGAAWQPGLRPLPPADVLVYRLKGARVIVRPSGTEPILKAYFEVMRPVAGGADGGGLVSTREAAGAELERLRAAVVAAVSE